tara:strand:+ start:1465 stop:2484 length:1020 start_codon:yes stop_codon:yes gene_type:complete
MIKVFILFLYLIHCSGLYINFNSSWQINSYFDYRYPNNSVLNLAYPSSIAYYYVSIIPPHSNYNLNGFFLNKNVFEVSLTVYFGNGFINYDYKPLNTYIINNRIDYNITTNNNFLYVIQRYYVNLDYYDSTDLINNLLNVYDLDKHYNIPFLNQNKRSMYSEIITKPFQKIISFISPSVVSNFTKFYLPGFKNGLFKDLNHYYLLSLPGNYKLLKIEGYYNYSKVIPYVDFITIDQDTTSTDNGIPFYKFNKDSIYNIYDINYKNIYVANYDVSDEEIYKIDSDANIIRWEKNNLNKAVIFRVINYNYKGIGQGKGPLSPEETKKIMVCGFYPEIIPIL